MEINQYHKQLTEQEIENGAHREAVGGMWDDIGLLQFRFLVDHGLLPAMRFLDIGCGCLRGGIHFIAYLNAGNYFGIDINRSLLDAGYDRELAKAGLQEKLPRENLLADERFGFSRFGTEFDMALSMSLFTHLPLNHIRVCLTRLAKCMKPRGRFFASFFECPTGRPVESQLTHEPGGIVTFPDRDPYHYWIADFSWAIRDLPWELNYVGEWQHPRAQKMLRFTRL